MDSSDALRIHARFEKIRKQMFMPAPAFPTRSQINAFARMLRIDTDVDPTTLTEDVVTYAWYFIKDRLHMEATTAGTDQWNDAQHTGWQLAVKLDRAQRLEHSTRGLVDG